MASNPVELYGVSGSRFQYQTSETLGNGAFGSVFRGIDTTTGQQVAIKLLPKKPESQAIFERETKAYKELKDHPNVVKMIDYNEKDLSIFLEFCDSGTILTWVEKIPKSFINSDFHEDNIRFVVCQLVEGLSYLHSCNIIHRDVKCDNILLTKSKYYQKDREWFGISFVPKIADMGTAGFGKVIEGDTSSSDIHSFVFKTLAGTPFYMAPEIYSKLALLRARGPPSSSRLLYTTAVDVYSLAVVIIVLLNGSLPSVNNMFDIISNPTISPELKNLLERMIEEDPTKRIGWDEIRAHPWIQFPEPCAYLVMQSIEPLSKCDNLIRIPMSVNYNIIANIERHLMVGQTPGTKNESKPQNNAYSTRLGSQISLNRFENSIISLYSEIFSTMEALEQAKSIAFEIHAKCRKERNSWTTSRERFDRIYLNPWLDKIKKIQEKLVEYEQFKQLLMAKSLWNFAIDLRRGKATLVIITTIASFLMNIIKKRLNATDQIQQSSLNRIIQSETKELFVECVNFLEKNNENSFPWESEAYRELVPEGSLAIPDASSLIYILVTQAYLELDADVMSLIHGKNDKCDPLDDDNCGISLPFDSESLESRKNQVLSQLRSLKLIVDFLILTEATNVSDPITSNNHQIAQSPSFEVIGNTAHGQASSLNIISTSQTFSRIEKFKAYSDALSKFIYHIKEKKK